MVQLIIALLVFLPFVSAPVIYSLGRQREIEKAQINITNINIDININIYIKSICIIEVILSLLLALCKHNWFVVPNILTAGLSFTADGFRIIYAILTSFLWLASTIFSKEYFSKQQEYLNSYWFFTLITLGATQGVMLSADFMTTFIFFEILSLSSFTWVLHRRTKEAIHAAYLYLTVMIIGGLIALMGLFLLYHACGTLQYALLHDVIAFADRRELLVAGICLLFGFGTKAGMFPVHIWLPDSYTYAPSPASALLSGILSKVGIFGILMTALEVVYNNWFFGLLVLFFGLITMALGAVLALLSINLKRTLACSSMSQIGFILTGIGSLVLCQSFYRDAGMALSGIVLHMINHSIIKLTLFLIAGTVVINLHTLTLNDIRGWGRNKTPLKIAFGLAGLGISGMPFFNGYISKTMLHESLLYLMEFIDSSFLPFLHIAEWVFLISGGCTFAYMLKLYFCIFQEKNADEWRQERYDREYRFLNHNSTCVILIAALLVIPLGQPEIMTRLAAYAIGENIVFHAFTWENLQGALISLLTGILIYLWIVIPVLRPSGIYVDHLPEKLNMETLIYKPLAHLLVFVGTLIGRTLSEITDTIIVFLRRTVLREEQPKQNNNFWKGFRRATESVLEPRNFSFVLLMTCIGIIAIFTFLLIFLRFSSDIL